MDFNERLDKTHAKMDELKAKINQSVETSKKARELKKEEIMADMSDMDKAIDNFADKVEATVNDSISESDKALDTFADKVESVVNKALDESGKAINDFADAVENKVNSALDSASDSIEGDVVAASENARLASERRESKLNSMRLKAQMNKEAAKDRITAKKEAKDKASQEKRIVELLDYADSCQQLTLAMALETEAAVLEAAAEIADYNEKYGD